MHKARRVQDAHWADFETRWTLLSPLQQAVLARLVEQGERFRPFEAASLETYAALLGERDTTSEARSALEALHDKGFVVSVGRGLYTLEDGSMSEWLAGRQPGGDGTGGGMSGGPR